MISAGSVACMTRSSSWSGTGEGTGLQRKEGHVADLFGVTISQYTTSQMSYDLRRLRLKGLIFQPPRTNRYFVTPYGWKVARLFSRLEARVFRPAVAMFAGNDAVLPFPRRASLDRVDAQLDELIYEAFPQTKAS
jgi:hypothetical protein